MAICALIMLVGIAIRFTFLDAKIFGNDEATTSVHVSGKTVSQYGATMFDGRRRTASEVLVFQEPDPRHGIGDVVRSLAVEDPQHPPLYYLLERQWELRAGSSISSRRVLAAVYGAVAVLCAVWMGYELDSLVAGLITGALVAASPFAIAYSQVAREYSLWLALTFASSALFVRAVKRGNTYLWPCYALVSIAGLYTDALFTIVVIGHGVALAFPVARRRSAVRGFAVSLIVIVAAYAPWIAALAYGYTHGIVTNNVYLSAGLSLKPFLLKWVFNIGTLFYDGDYRYPKTAVLIIPGLIALGVAFLACARRVRDNPCIGLIFTLGGVALVALVLPDFIHHEQRSTAARYLLPLWVACYAALGASLALGFRSSRAWIRWSSFGFVLVTAATGFGSFAISAKRDTWWVDGSTAPIGPIVQAIDRTENPTVVYHATWGPGTGGPELWDFTVVMLADMVPPTTQFIQYGRDEPTAMPTSADHLFLLDPSDATIAALRARGDGAVKVAEKSTASVSGEIAALRQSVARDRERQGSDNLPPSPSLWTVQLR